MTLTLFEKLYWARHLFKKIKDNLHFILIDIFWFKSFGIYLEIKTGNGTQQQTLTDLKEVHDVSHILNRAYTTYNTHRMSYYTEVYRAFTQSITLKIIDVRV